MASRLVLPYHESPVTPLASALSSYISKTFHYGQQDDVKSDCQTLELLRNDALRATDPQEGNIIRIQSYIGQLMWLTEKLPNNIDVEFSWYPTLGYNSNKVETLSNTLFELVNMVYNLAALYSNIAMHSQGTDDAHKTAAFYFQLAAGTLSFLQNEIIPKWSPPTTSDLDSWSLSCLEKLMLAQAQEFVWQKAVKSGYKDSLIGKIAAQVADLYAMAADFGTKSEGIKSEWIHHMKAKHYHFMAVAQYRTALDSLERNQHGEEVARLTDCLDCIKHGLKESKYISRQVAEAMNALRSKTEQDLKTATGDNDMIYLQDVPSKYQLPMIERKMLVSSKVPEDLSNYLVHLGSGGKFKRKLFSKLPSIAVQSAAEQYEHEKTQFVNHKVIGQIEQLGIKIHELLQALGLPGSLEAMDEPLELPESLKNRAEKLRQRNAPQAIYDQIQHCDITRAKCKSMLDSITTMLHAESSEDESSRRKYGTDRWPRPSSQEANPELYELVQQNIGYSEHAERSDSILHRKAEDNNELLTILSGPEEYLKKFVPHSDRYTMPEAVIHAAEKLRHGLRDIQRLEAERNHRIELILQKSTNDLIESELFQEAARVERENPSHKLVATDFTQVISRGLQKYEEDLRFIAEQDRKQEIVMKRIQDANTEFVTARKGDTTTKRKEEVLQSLNAAYYTYKEVSNNLARARKFYNDLISSLNKLNVECEAFVNKRRTESSSLISNTTPDISTLNIDTAASLTQQKKDAHEAKSSTGPENQQPKNIASPQPTRIKPAGQWNADMGINFEKMNLKNTSDGGKQSEATKTSQSKFTNWDPNKPIRFG